MPNQLPTHSAPSTRPDLGQYRAMHLAIRASNDRLVAAVGDLRRSSGDRSVGALGRWYAGYADELRGHHRIEDTIFFPALAARVPSYVEYSAALDHDHHRLDELIDEVTSALQRLAAAAGPWETDHDTALTAVVELRDLMSAHLDMEDNEILPMFERHFTADEYAAMDTRARRSVSLRHALFFVPWFVASVPPEVADAAMREAPPLLKVIHRLTARRYHRLAEAALIGTTSHAGAGA